MTYPNGLKAEKITLRANSSDIYECHCNRGFGTIMDEKIHAYIGRDSV